MKQLFIWAFAAAALLTGCASDEITEQHDLQGENGRKAITFKTYLPGHTRGYSATPADINNFAQELKQGFRMTAVMGDSIIINGARYYADPKTSDCFPADGSAYTWPDKESALTFMAYYPSSEMCQLNVKSGTLTFTPDGETDIMAAGTTASVGTENGNVVLTFEHLLAHVRMNVACSDDVAGASFTLTGLSLQAPASATYSFASGEVSVGEYETTYSFIADESEDKELKTGGEVIGSVMVPTQEGVTHHLVVDYSVTIGNTTKEYTKETDVALKAGFVNQLNITVKSDKLITVTSWTNGWGVDDKYNQNIDFSDNGMTDLSGEDGNGRRYIDLGLPSRTLWAAWNIGADSPDVVGGYYAWGETKTKSEFNFDTYKWDIQYRTDPAREDPYYGTGKTILDLEDDAAYANWGEDWCMPDSAQFRELINPKYTTYESEELEGMLGIRFTSKKFPENSIFLPATGAMTSGDPVAPSVGGYYWCRNIQESFGSAESFFFRAQNPQPALSGEPQRTEGLCVRAVRVGN